MNHQQKTVLAVCLITVGGGLFSYNIWNQMRPPEIAADGAGSEAYDESLPPLDDEPEDTSAMESPSADAAATTRARTLQADLLALFGSFEPGARVANPFELNDHHLAAAAAPLVERLPSRAISWETEPDPPEMHVTLTLLTGAVARAAVDGAIVGVGDRVTAGQITRIAEDGVEVDTGRYRLFYDMSADDHPREFRDELARRAEATQRAGNSARESATDDAQVDPTQSDEGRTK